MRLFGQYKQQRKNKMKTFKIIIIMLSLAACGGGGGDSHPYAGTWQGQAVLAEDTCGIGLEPLQSFVHTISIDGSAVSLDTGNTTLQGQIHGNEILTSRNTSDANCNGLTQVGYLIEGNTALVILIVEAACGGGIHCRVSYVGEARND
jgi:hypothetical protein